MGKIHLYWWSEIFIQRKDKENYGDILGKYLVEKISGTNVTWYNPGKRRFFGSKKVVFATIGSILGHIKKDWFVWGSGIISKSDKVAEGVFLAVRGPQSRRYLTNLGYSVPEIYGDPGLLLPDFYNPIETKKTYKLGIIPHYNDYKKVKELYKGVAEIKVIDLMTNDIEATTNEILSCEKILSSSLHGIIIPHAYEIPAVWIRFSDKVFGDGIKYQDYFESVALEPYVPAIYSNPLTLEEAVNILDKFPNLPDKLIVEKLKTGIMEVCPFKN